MFAASYVGTRSGLWGLGNRLIRLRLVESGHKWAEFFRTDANHASNVLRASHTELVFEPGDGVDSLMPDGTCEPDATGALWCFSSTGFEKVNPESKRRAGHVGGARFKRINVNNNRWTHQEITRVDPYTVAERCVNLCGKPYDFQNILGFVSWVIPHKKSREMCSEIVLSSIGVRDSYRFDPCSAMVIFESFK